MRATRDTTRPPGQHHDLIGKTDRDIDPQVGDRGKQQRGEHGGLPAQRAAIALLSWALLFTLPLRQRVLAAG
jgi:hypothetical protein